MTTELRVLVLSVRSVRPKAANAALFEFEDVIAEVSGGEIVDMIVDRDSRRFKFARLADLALPSGSRRRPVGHLLPPYPQHPTLAGSYDVVVIVTDSIWDISMAHTLRGIDYGTLLFYTPEVWKGAGYDWAQLHLGFEVFDRVFVGTAHSVPALDPIAGNVQQLPPATDTLRFAPTRPFDERTLDLTWYGRRVDAVHDDLLAASQEHGWSYHFDPTQISWDAIDDHRRHRGSLAELLGTTRFAPSFVARVNQPELHCGEREIAGRYFEAASAGAIMIGQRPDGGFERYFPWRGAVVEVPDGGSLSDAVIELSRDPSDLAARSAANVSGSMATNDWAHRWAAMLDAVGLPHSAGLDRRLATLAAQSSSLREARS